MVNFNFPLKNLILIFVFFFSCLFACFSFSPCYAVSDYVFTFDSDNIPSSSSNLCIRGSQHPCSDYNYLIIESNFLQFDLSPNNMPFQFAINTVFQDNNNSYISSQYNFPLGLSDFSVLSLSLNIYSVSSWFVSSQSSLPSGWFIKLTFTENYSSSVVPSGSLSISENGTYDVTNYASAVVDVPQSSDNLYHDDLQEIKGAIIIGCAVLLVLYFFYCIYRMIIKSTGGQ